jgi:geranylgeranyldiphosphate transferase
MDFSISSIMGFVLAFALGYMTHRLASSGKAVTAVHPRQYGYAKEKAPLEAVEITGDEPDCPFHYILRLYGHHHFAPFVKVLRPGLKEEDPEKYSLTLDIMDAVHLCLILVDDICDESPKRKNRTTAHLIYGSSETANRAYFMLTKVINRALKDRPVLGVELLKALEQILEGQDLSLIWRRDGFKAFNYGDDERVPAYKRMAQLKTGTLFVLLGRLLNDGGDQLDDLCVRFGWYAQLQNDCKNIYSDEYSVNKGAIAEDLRNGEFSFPIVVALDNAEARQRIQRALEGGSESDISSAIVELESPRVRKLCMKAMQEASQGLEKMVAVWGRREEMTSA